MTRYLSIIFLTFISTLAYSQIVINEISYNPPESGQDSLEYIELYNLGSNAVDLSNFVFTSGINLTFDTGISIEAGGYLIVCESSDAMMNVFGVEGIVWDGGMSNGGEAIALKDAAGVLVDSLSYDDNAPWPSQADGTDGGGSSIELCDATSDNTLGANWRAATNDIGMIINGAIVLGTPGVANTVLCETQPNHIVNAAGLSFTPKDITIEIGETVRWENTSGIHNVNGGLDVYPDNPEGIFSGAPEAAPWTWDYTFNIPGIYNYQCDLHVGAGMVGTVTVEGESVPPLPLVITEIMYNDPALEDSLEFIEMVNVGTESINLEGLTFSSGIIHTFADKELGAGEFVVVAKFPDVILDKFGISAIGWTDGELSNSGELVELVNADGVLVDAVMYDDEGDWSQQADGLGNSLVLCKPNSDNNVGTSWGVSSYSTDISIDGVAIMANPGVANYCLYSVDEISQTNSNGQITFEGSVRVLGRALGVNLRPAGLQFTITDEDGDGIALFSGGNNFGYETVVEGDLLYVTGNVTQFNGLAQIGLFDVDFVSTDGPAPTSTVVTSLGEATESQLLTLENVHLVNINEWSGLGSGFNVRVTDGSTDTFAVRIDADVDLYNMGYPQGTFNVTGIGGQFDSSVPYTDGYQLLPRYKEDISPYNEFVQDFPEYDIPTLTTVNSSGVTDSLGRKVTLTGTSHGINWRPSGLQFWVIDENNNGIQVFSFDDNVGYDVKEGDILTIKGTIDQFNGQTEIVPSEIVINSEGQNLVTPLNLGDGGVAALDESFESKYVTADDAFQLVDPAAWAGDGSSFSVEMTNGLSKFNVFIDADTEFANMLMPPGDFMSITGIVGQSDSDEPYDSGYAIWVRYDSDLSVVNAVIEANDTDLVRLFPNPARNILSLDTKLAIEKIEILDCTGRQLELIYLSSNQIDISNLASGAYFLRLHSGDVQFIHRLVKM